MTVSSSPFPGQDLKLVLEGALGSEGHLLTAGEKVIVERILSLPDDTLELYARLTSRRPRVFRVSELRYSGDVAAQVQQLLSLGLAHGIVPDDHCLVAFTADELRSACRRLGLDHRGGRPVIEARLLGQRWMDEPVLLLGHRGLLVRLEVLFFQTPHITRQDLVLDRLGAVRWAAYEPTGGPGLFPNRGAFARWERARKRAWLPGDLEHILTRGPSGAALDPWRYAVEGRLTQIEDQPPDIRAPALAVLLAQGAPVRIPLARALEQAGDRVGALDVVLAGQGSRTGDGLACGRTARRLARGLRRSIPPLPLKEARVRSIAVAGGAATGAGARPLWPAGGGAMVVIERAVIRWLGALGRRAIHAEQSPWVGLYALLFADLYFLPVPNMLPTAFRTGPMDVGTPAFYDRLRDVIEARLASVLEFGMQSYKSCGDGVRLSGLWNAPAALFLAEHAPPQMIVCIVGRLAREGWGVASGLPDLFVVSGSPERLELHDPQVSALPAKLPQSAFLAEIKGPTDTLRDEQRVWLDILVESNIHVELWELTSNSFM